MAARGNCYFTPKPAQVRYVPPTLDQLGSVWDLTGTPIKEGSNFDGVQLAQFSI